jgi:hypothetical protein
MKKIFLLMGVVTLLATTGCIIADGGGGRHERHEGPGAVIVGPPVVVVGPPVEYHEHHDRD